MLNFEYYTPTKVIFGKGAERSVAKELGELGAKKVLIHFGSDSAMRSGLYQRIHSELTEAGMSVSSLGGVLPNPHLSLVREGVALCEKEGVDFILAIGGGSVVDSAKSISLAAANHCPPWDITTGAVKPTAKIPVGVVLTISAAGSEMSSSLVITNDDNLKRGVNLPLARPEVAFMNPELTYSVPPYATACGVVDILMHTLERYLTPETDTELCDRISEGLMVSVKNAGLVVANNPLDYEARATLMWASSLSHNDLTGCGKAATLPAHKLSHEISGMFDTAHGAALSVIFPAWARFIYRRDIRKFAQLATRVWGVEFDFDCPEKTALGGIAAMIGYFSALRMPVTLEEIGVPPESFAEMAKKATTGGQKPVASYIPLYEKEIIEIFELARGAAAE